MGGFISFTEKKWNCELPNKNPQKWHETLLKDIFSQPPDIQLPDPATTPNLAQRSLAQPKRSCPKSMASRKSLEACTWRA